VASILSASTDQCPDYWPAVPKGRRAFRRFGAALWCAMDRPPGERRLIAALIVVTALMVVALAWQAMGA